jgi:DNA-binding FrmR family transcriptional regulator
MSKKLSERYSAIVGTRMVGEGWQDHDLLEQVAALEAKLEAANLALQSLELGANVAATQEEQRE